MVAGKGIAGEFLLFDFSGQASPVHQPALEGLSLELARKEGFASSNSTEHNLERSDVNTYLFQGQQLM